ncbi:sigma-54-dependent Fis family transcriptional regulator [Companilactobacillus kedongensis]|uniref:sigma-54-dependent Fis family transcriptional regulator n=1 Tax=Companilactobacillus kedongensis TaxID=2486004 RepID=UPI0013DDA4DF|nr:PrpR N-terminal domain-containing protein [Companilactobacillus kedongensis]
MKFRILGIYPYAGLEQSIKNQLPKFSELKIDHFVGDLSYGIEIATKQLKENNYDAIISRGGTKRALEQKFDLPIIDIGVSKYDILQAIQSLKHINKIAVVGFDFLSINAEHVIKDFNKNLSVFKIESLDDAQKILLQLKEDNYDVIIGDRITSRLANKIGINCILISSGDESVISALQNCLTILKNKYSEKESSRILLDLLRYRNESLVVTDEDNMINYTANLNHSPKLIPHIKKRIRYINWEENKTSIFMSQNKYYQMNKIRNSTYIISKLNNYLPNKAINTPTDENEEIFNAYLKSNLSQKFLNALEIYKHNDDILFIAGENGSGKNQLISIISSSEAKKTFRINCSELTELKLNDLENSLSSPLLDTQNIIIFDHLDKINVGLQRKLMYFINETLLFKRNKLIFSYELDSQNGVNLTRILLKQPKYIELRPFNYLDSKQISLLISLLINQLNISYGREILGVTDITFDRILRGPWERNYWQFITVLTESYKATKSPYIDLSSLKYGLNQENIEYNLTKTSKINHVQRNKLSIPIENNLDDSIDLIVQKELAMNNFNKTKTAKSLGISRSTLWRLLKRIE